MNNGVSDIGHGNRYAVRVTGPDRRQTHIAFGNMCRIVTNSFTRLDFMQLQDRSEEFNDGFADFLSRFLGRHTPV